MTARGWEESLDSVFERVLKEGERPLSEELNGEKERNKVYEEMCELLDSTLHLTVDTLLNCRDKRAPERDDVVSEEAANGESEIPLQSYDNVEGVGNDLYRSESCSSSCTSLASSPTSLHSIEVYLLKVAIRLLAGSARQLDYIKRDNQTLKEENIHLRQQVTDIIPCADLDASKKLMVKPHQPKDIDSTIDSTSDDEKDILIAELIETKYLLAQALSMVEEEKLHRYKILKAVDKLLV